MRKNSVPKVLSYLQLVVIIVIIVVYTKIFVSSHKDDHFPVRFNVDNTISACLQLL